MIDWLEQTWEDFRSGSEGASASDVLLHGPPPPTYTMEDLTIIPAEDLPPEDRERLRQIVERSEVDRAQYDQEVKASNERRQLLTLGLAGVAVFGAVLAWRAVR